MLPGRTRVARKSLRHRLHPPPQLAGPHPGKNPAARPGHPATRTDELVTLAHTTVPTRDHSEIGKSITLLDTAPRCRNPRPYQDADRHTGVRNWLTCLPAV